MSSADSISVSSDEDGLAVTIQASTDTQRTHVFSWRWVRDHGEDTTSFDAGTKQRRVYALDGDVAPALSAHMGTEGGNPVVSITWNDASSTWISVATITELLHAAPAPSQLLWHDPAQPSVTKGHVDDVLVDDDALASWLTDLALYGYGVLGGFRGDHDAAEALANRIGYPRSSIFGALWDLASDVDAHNDTAYTQSFLAPHTDGTYSHEAPGLQMFCCTDRDGTGGESIVVDAFAIAETLRHDHPDDFDILTRVSVPAHYIEPGVELRASRPAIRLAKDGAVAQVSMNNYDRSPMLLPQPEMDAFYRAYGRLHELANDQRRWLAVRLETGDVLINDNWRVLHGRHTYTGARRFVGCYLNHEDFESRCRTLGVDVAIPT